jgi:hypothetical protein
LIRVDLACYRARMMKKKEVRDARRRAAQNGDLTWTEAPRCGGCDRCDMTLTGTIYYLSGANNWLGEVESTIDDTWHWRLGSWIDDEFDGVAPSTPCGLVETLDEAKAAVLDALNEEH